jgi:hypothetical protein
LLGGLSAKAKNLMFIKSGDSIDKACVGYLFGLQAQLVHFIRAKTNFTTDLLASLLLAFPKALPGKVDATFSQCSQSTLRYAFDFKRDDGVLSESEHDDWMSRITSVTRDLSVNLVVQKNTMSKLR